MVETAAYLLSVGFRVLLARHQVRHLMQADLAPRQQSDQGAGKEIGKRKAKMVQALGKAFGRIGLGHSGCPSRVVVTSRLPQNGLVYT